MFLFFTLAYYKTLSVKLKYFINSIFIHINPFRTLVAAAVYRAVTLEAELCPGGKFRFMIPTCYLMMIFSTAGCHILMTKH